MEKDWSQGWYIKESSYSAGLLHAGSPLNQKMKSRPSICILTEEIKLGYQVC